MRQGKAREVVVLTGFMDRFQKGSSMTPKDFRNTLATERRKRLWSKEAMEAYFGHEGGHVIDEHYTYLDDDERVELLRREVVSKVDEVLEDHLSRWRGVGADIITLKPSG